MASTAVDVPLAFFSTNGGRRPFRTLGNPKPPVLCRSNREKDVKNYAAQLRKLQPHFCNSIFEMSRTGTHFEPRWFFDEHDFHVQGGRFLYDVIATLIAENQTELTSFCQRWSEANKENAGVAQLLFREKGNEFYFHTEDLETLGEYFLDRALAHMRKAYELAQAEHVRQLQSSSNHENQAKLRIVSAPIPNSKQAGMQNQGNPPNAARGPGRFPPSQPLRTGPWAPQNAPMAQGSFGAGPPLVNVAEAGPYHLPPNLPTDVSFYIVPGGAVPDVPGFTYFPGQMPSSAPHMQSQFMHNTQGANPSWRGGKGPNGSSFFVPESMMRIPPANHPVFDPSRPQGGERDLVEIHFQQPQRHNQKSERGRGRGGRGRGNGRRSSFSQSQGYGDNRSGNVNSAFISSSEERAWQSEAGHNVLQDPMNLDGYPRQRSVNVSQEFPGRHPNHPETYFGEVSHQKQRKSSRGSFGTPGPRNLSQQLPISRREEAESGVFAMQIPSTRPDFQPVALSENRKVIIPENCESWFELWAKVDQRISKEEFTKTITDVTAIECVKKDPSEDYASVRFHSTSDLAKVYNHPGLYCAGVRLIFHIPEFYLGPNNTPEGRPRNLRYQSANGSWTSQRPDSFPENHPAFYNIPRRQTIEREGRANERMASARQRRSSIDAAPLMYSPQDARSSLSETIEHGVQADTGARKLSITKPVEDHKPEANSPARLPPVTEDQEDVMHHIPIEGAPLNSMSSPGDKLASEASSASSPLDEGQAIFTPSTTESASLDLVRDSTKDFATPISSPEFQGSTIKEISQTHEDTHSGEKSQTVDVAEPTLASKPKVQLPRTTEEKRKQNAKSTVLPAIPKPFDRNVKKNRSAELAARHSKMSEFTSSTTSRKGFDVAFNDHNKTDSHDRSNLIAELSMSDTPLAASDSLSKSDQAGHVQEGAILKLDDLSVMFGNGDNTSVPHNSSTISQSDGLGITLGRISYTDDSKGLSAELNDESEVNLNSRKPAHTDGDEVFHNAQSRVNSSSSESENKSQDKANSGLLPLLSQSINNQELPKPDDLDFRGISAENTDGGVTEAQSSVPLASTVLFPPSPQESGRSSITRMTTMSPMNLPQLPEGLTAWQKEYVLTMKVLQTGSEDQQRIWKPELDKVKSELTKAQERIVEGDQKLHALGVTANYRKTWNKKKRALVFAHSQNVEQLTLLYGRFDAEVQALAEKKAAELSEPALKYIQVAAELPPPERTPSSPDEFKAKVSGYYEMKKTYDAFWVTRPFTPTTTTAPAPAFGSSVLNINFSTGSESSSSTDPGTIAGTESGQDITSGIPLAGNSGFGDFVMQGGPSMLTNHQHDAATSQADIRHECAETLVNLSQHFDFSPTSFLTPEPVSRPTSPIRSRHVSFPKLPSKVKSDDGHHEHSRPTSPTPSQTAALSMSYAKVARSNSPVMGSTNLAGAVDKGKGRATSIGVAEGAKKSQDDKGAADGTGDDWKVGPEGVWGDKGILGNKGG